MAYLLVSLMGEKERDQRGVYMVIFWRIRYLDRNDRQFKNRDLFLDTERLSTEMRAVVELAIESKTTSTQRDFLKHRHLFQEDNTEGAAERWLGNADRVQCFSLHDYFEDESGKELSSREMGAILTGSPTAMLIPSGAEQHDIDFMLAEKKAIPLAEVTLSQEDINLLGYFVRDLRELFESAFMRDGPGTITSGGSAATDPTLETAVTDEEIRSFVTIFRRLYMEKEPANFLKAAAVFERALGSHPYAKWVAGTAKCYEAKLKSPVEGRPFIPNGTCSFTRKRLIDVFLYTRYAHQPDENRQKQYVECLNQVGGRKNMLMWLFLTELWKSSLEIGNAGRQIAYWFEHYCNHHKLTPAVLPSVLHDSPGIGVKEKEAARQERLFHEKAKEMAEALWNERGCPAGGPTQFLQEAQTTLRKHVNNNGARGAHPSS